MTTTRRDFLTQTSLAAVSLAATRRGALSESPSTPSQDTSDTYFRDICIAALDAAMGGGASYADVRVVNSRNQFVEARENHVSVVSDGEVVGIGVRALVDGAWGFTAGRDLAREDARRAAQSATEQAAANARGAQRRVALAPVDAYPHGTWQSPIRRDPFAVPMEEKIELLLAANRAALSVPGVRYVRSSLAFLRNAQTFASTDGSVLQQTMYRSAPYMKITAASNDSTDLQSRSSSDIAPMALGYEHVESADFPARAAEWAEEAVQKLSAASVQPGEYDLVLDPTNLVMAIHTTIGQPTELDRVLGDEAVYAGTSFITPPQEVIGKLRYGPDSMNVQGDRTQRGALATVGWDDEGVPADSWPIVKDGILVDFQTTRDQAGQISDLTGVTRSHGCSQAASWNAVQMQRMPNVSLLPGGDDHLLDDLVAATDRGILARGQGEYSVDQPRSAFRFGAETFHEIRGGRVVGMLRDAAYQGRTLEFWNSMDMLGGSRSYVLCGILSDLKGHPAQPSAISHGCPPARFRRCAVVNTGR